MSDKFHSLTVVLKRDLPKEETELLMNAIRQFREVADVTAIQQDTSSHMAIVRAKHYYGDKLCEVLYPKDEK